jgi:hypothetical protein
VKQTSDSIAELFAAKGIHGEPNGGALQFMKIATEKYIFDRTETVLRAMYLHRDGATSETFERKRQKIVGSLTAQQICAEVLLNESLAAMGGGGVAFCAVACP